MASDNFIQLAIPRFDGYYDHWSMLIANVLRSKEYWQIISQGIIEPPFGSTTSNVQRTKIEAQWLKDFKVKNYFFQSIDRSILKIILCKDISPLTRPYPLLFLLLLLLLLPHLNSPQLQTSSPPPKKNLPLLSTTSHISWSLLVTVSVFWFTYGFLSVFVSNSIFLNFNI